MLLENLRNTVLPLIMEDWNELEVTEQSLCSQLNNFLCGLHLTVGIADVCEQGQRKFEVTFCQKIKM